MDSEYEEKFIENHLLDNLIEDYLPFQKYINKSINKYVTSFYNLSKDCKLIIPIPKKNKNFTTIKDFIDNSSITHQQIFWKKVAKEIKIMLKNMIKYILIHMD